MTGHKMFQLLPLKTDLETKQVLKQLTLAHRALAELKGITETIPNQSILINTLPLQEAKYSSEIENIITTQDELYQSDAARNQFSSAAAKEVHHYAAALHYGFKKVNETGLITNNTIIEIQATLEEMRSGYRKLPGTVLKNSITNETIYEPPQHIEEIMALMNNLEQYINDKEFSHEDALLKMAIIHHRFESIHPFYDGNGRTGRIINVLYLVKEGLLDIPVLYLSRYINQHKTRYYELLQKTSVENQWEDYILYMLQCVEETSKQTIEIVRGIRDLMQKQKDLMKRELPKIYSQDLLNNIFMHPYTRIDALSEELSVQKKTASQYLSKLEDVGILEKQVFKRRNIYINLELMKLLSSVSKNNNMSSKDTY